MQNSGLGVSMNALVSLNQVYDIPALLVVSWRGHGGEDAPEHLIMGGLMEEFMRLLRVPFALLQTATMERDLGTITRVMSDTRKPVALLVPKGVLQE